MIAENLSLGLAFIVGLISFVSPCVLPLVPAYIGYMGGKVTNTVSNQVVMTGGNQAALRVTAATRFNTAANGVAFVLGFTVVFVLLGILTTAFVQQVGGRNISILTDVIARFGGVLIVFFGLHFMGVLPRLFNRLLGQSNHLLASPLLTIGMALALTALLLWGFTGTLIPALYTTIPTTAGDSVFLNWSTVVAIIGVGVLLLWLMLGGAFNQPQAFWSRLITRIQTLLYTDTRGDMHPRTGQGYLGSAIMGVIFSAGWTPCIGPVYGAVLTLAAQTGDVGRAAPLLTAYSLGLGVPFVLTAILLDSAQGLLHRLQRNMRTIELVSGIILVIIGISVATQSLQNLSQVLAGEYSDAAIAFEEQVVNQLTGQGSANTQPVPTAIPATADPAQSASVDEAVAGNAVGNRAPSFTTVTDQGASLTLEQFQGEYVLLNFWATWCGPCRVEMPDMEAVVQARADQGFNVLAINNSESLEQMTTFRQEIGVTFPFLLDEDGSIQRLYGVISYPSSFLVDPNGIIVERHFGPMTAETIQAMADRSAQ
jgi:cytochrome c biogenesis protein CcdA/peroxiredoxin